MPSWRLQNADEIAAANKYTFYKPSRELIAKVLPGEEVKLIFLFESDDPEAPAAERMWVEVETIGPGETFTGRLDNEPEWITDLQPGDPVSFDASHIIATEHDDADNIVRKYTNRGFVTSRILQDGAKVGYLYREAPEQENDSGWRFMANDESAEYMETEGNTAYVSVGRVLSFDDSFIHLLDAAPGSAFVRDPDTQQFVALDNE